MERFVLAERTVSTVNTAAKACPSWGLINTPNFALHKIWFVHNTARTFDLEKRFEET
jgi:hypothetical protein